jgi:hypothetical protein
MLSKLRGLLPANRIVALIGLAGAAAAFIASIQTSLVPGSPAAEACAKAAAAIVAVVAFLRIVQKFLDGSQQWDALTAGGIDDEAELDIPQQPSQVGLTDAA